MRSRIKNYLRSYQDYERDVEYLQERQEQLRARIEDIGTQANFDNEKVMKTRDNSYEKLMHIYLNQKLEIGQRKEEAVKVCVEIENHIDNHCTQFNAIVLKLHYINNYQFTEITELLKFSYAKILKAHSDGIKELEEANILGGRDEK